MTQEHDPRYLLLSKTLWTACFLLGVMLSGLSGCASAPHQPTGDDQADLIWPLPPEAPRIKYLRSLWSEDQIKPPESKMVQLRDGLLGKPKQAGRRLKKPYAVHADREGRVFVADSGWGKVLVFDEKNKSLEVWGANGQGVLAKPLGITSDSHGRIYVTDSAKQRAIVYDRDGNFLYAMGLKGEMERPVGIAVDEARERVYIADTKAHQIVVYNFQGIRIGLIGRRGDKPGEFNFPTNLVIDKIGQLYVTDSMNFRVQVLGPDGDPRKSFGSNGDGRGQFVRAKGIALDSHGNVYVADSAFNNFQIFDSEGNILLDVGSHGNNPGQFILPAGIFIDQNDNIYVADQYNFRIQIFQYLRDSEISNATNPSTRNNEETQGRKNKKGDSTT
ncbi:MAG: 6-bladed beta-propeller [Gammaproteobacteria bacterium]|nr:6-bladed beta-propeller [Gammaproteobacteria bacterium]